MQKVLIIDNNDSFTYNLVQLIEESKLCEFEVKRIDELKLNDVELFDKILISPGPGLPSEKPLLKTILQSFAATKSILGICLGHQAMGEAFGCKLIQLDKILHGEHTKVKLYSNKVFENIPEEITVGRYHSWIIDKNSIDSNFEIIAEDLNGVVMGIKHSKHNIFGLQFHPESIMTEYGKEMIENWLKTDVET